MHSEGIFRLYTESAINDFYRHFSVRCGDDLPVPDQLLLGRESATRNQRSIENAMCFGVFEGNKNVAFGRVIMDCATYAYIGTCSYWNRIAGEGCRNY